MTTIFTRLDRWRLAALLLWALPVIALLPLVDWRMPGDGCGIAVIG